MSKEILLENLKQNMIKNCLCPLKNQAKQIVFGNGFSDTSFMFIGEAPGKKEDEAGLPFVGNAGKVLDYLLKSISLNKNVVYLTSIEKFHPPHNRIPTKKEIIACFPYLQKQITIIDPKIIVFLGSTAFKTFCLFEKDISCQTKTLTKIHGKPIVGKSNRIYFPTFHPASLLYNPKLKSVLENDFKKIQELLI